MNEGLSNGDKHFYAPADGHGLARDPLNSIVAPRPIGWVSTRGQNGAVNLAPYSFFNAFNYRPPIVGFSSVGEKDSLRNARETGEFVWNLVTRPLAEQMNITSTPFEYDVDEFRRANLTAIDSRMVSVPRVAESPVNFECKVTDIVRLRDNGGAPVGAWLILGEVVGVHILNSLLKDGHFDTFGAGIIMRAGGPSAYAEVSGQMRFDLERPA